MIVFVCDLCNAELPDELTRLERHTISHSKAHIQHRNTTQGIPNYKKKEV